MSYIFNMEFKGSYLKQLKFSFVLSFMIKTLKNGNYNIRCKLTVNSTTMYNVYSVNIFYEFFDNLTYVAPIYDIEIDRKKNRAIYVTNGYPEKLIDEIKKIGFSLHKYTYVYKSLINASEYRISGNNLYDVDTILTKLFKSDASSNEEITTDELFNHI